MRDISGEKFELLPNSLTFSANSDGKSYAGAVNFFDEIDVEVKSELANIAKKIRFLN